MNNEEKEKETFLALCGEHDRMLVEGTVELRFMDFDRLTYLTDYLGFQDFNLDFWHEHVQKFRKNLEQLERLTEDSNWHYNKAAIEDTAELYSLWIRDFHGQAPTKQARDTIEELIREKDQDMLMELNEQADTQ